MQMRMKISSTLSTYKYLPKMAIFGAKMGRLCFKFSVPKISLLFIPLGFVHPQKWKIGVQNHNIFVQIKTYFLLLFDGHWCRSRCGCKYRHMAIASDGTLCTWLMVLAAPLEGESRWPSRRRRREGGCSACTMRRSIGEEGCPVPPPGLGKYSPLLNLWHKCPLWANEWSKNHWEFVPNLLFWAWIRGLVEGKWPYHGLILTTGQNQDSQNHLVWIEMCETVR